MNIKQFFPAIVCSLFLMASAASAQVAIKAGVNIASVSEHATYEDYDEFENSSVVGFQGGLAFDLPVTPMFSIQPEVLYIQKGGKVKAEALGSTYEARVYYNFIEVPVLLKLKFFDDEEGEGSGVYVVGGPFAGYAIDGKVARTVSLLGGEPSTRTDKFTFDDQDNAKRLDWGVSFGAGFKAGHFLFDARYNLGINNLVDNDANNDNDNKPYRRTRGVGLTLGYEF